MENDLVRCPLGHGLFLVADSTSAARCPACGAPLLAVRDDLVTVVPAPWPLLLQQAPPTPPAAPRPARIAIPA
jgi:hypothetical protein